MPLLLGFKDHSIHSKRLAHTSQLSVSPKWKHHKKSLLLAAPFCAKASVLQALVLGKTHTICLTSLWDIGDQPVFPGIFIFPPGEISWGFVGLYRINSLQNSNNFDQHFIPLYIIGLHRHPKTRRVKSSSISFHQFWKN